MLIWLLQPLVSIRAGVWAPDGNGEPVWSKLGVNDNEEPNPLQLSDEDQNGVIDWLDQFYRFKDEHNLYLWPGGTFVIDGYDVSFAPMWLEPGPLGVVVSQWQTEYPPLDTDGDHLPDELDDYPFSAANNSFEWNGGAFTINGIYHAFRAGWYGGSFTPTHSSGVPECLMDWFDPEAYHLAYELVDWPGLVDVWINGSQTSLPAVSYWGLVGVNQDYDSDGIPDELDPHTADPWNNTYFEFSRTERYVDGQLTVFPAQRYPGTSDDADGDDLPDVMDPYVTDSTNNSAWWPGRSFVMINYVETSLPPQMHRANAGDADSDGIPDDIDPYPYSALNVPTFYWPGGFFNVDNQSVRFDEGSYEGPNVDTDGDTIPDSLDYYPSDRYNHSDNQPYLYWQGDTFTINDQSHTFEPGYYTDVGTGRGDDDYDNIPDFADPYRNDGNNGNTVEPPPPPHFWWNGGTFHIDGTEYSWGSGVYEGSQSDLDNDGLADCFDYSRYYSDQRSYANDTANNSAYWDGGTFWINGEYSPFPVDSYGTPCGAWHRADAGDEDGDDIPDDLDPYPGDSTNNRGFFWPAGDDVEILIDSTPRNFSRQHYGNIYLTADGSWAPSINADGTPLNTDGDLLPDVADPYPQDKYNGNDTDGDSIPDAVEDLPAYADVLDLNDPADADVERSDGITYRLAYWYQMNCDPTWDLLTPFPADYDSDGDGMTERYEVRSQALNPRSPEDTVFTPYFNEPSEFDPYVLNIERYRAGLLPSDSIQSATEFHAVNGQTWAAIQEFIGDGSSSSEGDWDGDDISNRDEVLIFGTSPRIANTVAVELDASISGPDRTITEQEMMDVLISGRTLGTPPLTIEVGYRTWNAFKHLITPCSCQHEKCLGLKCAGVKDPAHCQCLPPPVDCDCTNDACPKGTNCNNKGCKDGVLCTYKKPPVPCICTNQWCPKLLCGNVQCTSPICSYTDPGGTPCQCTGGKECPHNTSCQCSNNCDHRKPDCGCGRDGCEKASCANAGIPGPASKEDCECKPDDEDKTCKCSHYNEDPTKNKCTGCGAPNACNNKCYTPPPCPCKSKTANCDCEGGEELENGEVVCQNASGGDTVPAECKSVIVNCPCGCMILVDDCACGEKNFIQDVEARPKECQPEPPTTPPGIGPSAESTSIGGLVLSAKKDSTIMHFVTPKRHGKQNQDTVEIVASNVSEAQFERFYRWECAAEGGRAGEKDKLTSYFIPRDHPKKFHLKIKSKKDGNTVAEFMVWVVWMDTTLHEVSAVNVSQLGPGLSLKTPASFKFTVTPREIVTRGGEIPDLEGGTATPPPGQKNGVCDAELQGGVLGKWDPSRRVSVACSAQKDCIDKNRSLPTDKLEGNDDAGTDDEKSASLYDNGYLVATDGPERLLIGARLTDANSYDLRYRFYEFVRLDLGGKWFQVSDMVPWRVRYKAKKVNDKWTNDDSFSDQLDEEFK